MDSSGFPFAVSAFYKFADLGPEELDLVLGRLRENGTRLGIRGLVLCAPEGCNGTVAGAPGAINEFESIVRSIPQFSGMCFKRSNAVRWPFRRFNVKRRAEIVTLRSDAVRPNIRAENRLSPEEWNRWLEERGDSIAVLDVRNSYETELGKFRDAIDPGIKRFSDFPEYVKTASIKRDTPVLMYCTGGIRCEKAIEEMYRQGYSEVYQLDGGILNYLAKFPNGRFDGECFVFDHRVALTRDLQPTKRYSLCPHCGDPGAELISCTQCGRAMRICAECGNTPGGTTCSKNCAYHQRRKCSLAEGSRTEG